jgi:hypothetical protein
MAEVAVKKSSEQKASEERAVTKPSGGALSGHWDPSPGGPFLSSSRIRSRSCAV